MAVLTAELEQATIYQQQLMEENKELKKQLLKQTEEASVQSREVQKAATQAKELKKELKREKDRNASLQQQRAEKGVQTLKETSKLEDEAHVQAIMSEMQCLKQQLQMKEKESCQLQSNLDEERKHHSRDLNDHQQQLSLLHEQLRQKQALVEEITEEKASLEEALEKSKQEQSTNSSKGTVELLDIAVPVEESQIKDLEQQVDDLKQNLSRQSSLVNYWREESERKEQVVTSLQQQLQAHSEEHSRTEEEKQQLLSELKQVGEEKEEAQQLNRSLQLQISSLHEVHEHVLLLYVVYT